MKMPYESMTEGKNKMDAVFDNLKKIVDHLEVGIMAPDMEISVTAVVTATHLAFLCSDLVEQIQKALDKRITMHDSKKDPKNGH